MKRSNIFLLSCLFLLSYVSSAQTPTADLHLPDPLLTEAGKTVATAEEWTNQRRPELLELFRSQVYGRIPDQQVTVRFRKAAKDQKVFEGRAVRKLIVAEFSKGSKTVDMNILLYIPARRMGPVPVFLGLNFFGNHTVQADPDIPVHQTWTRNNILFNITDNKADGLSRGVRSSRWPVERILQRGYGLATIYYGEIDPDFDDGFKNGVHALFDRSEEPDEWGSIATWAWGLSRAMDYLEQDKDVDKTKVIVIGHSRLGKTAIWAGAEDERFALVVSNDSGCGGAALSKRKFGEQLHNINGNFPHWFCKNFRAYNQKEENLPIDQHQLIGLIAPRPVYVASAQQDEWADPVGEYLSLHFAAPVFALLGTDSAIPQEHPGVNKPVSNGKLGYHMRSGSHDITPYDWERFMDFADRQLK